MEYTDEVLIATMAGDRENGSPILHARQAAELIKIPLRYRQRVLDEARTLNNVVGGILSGNLYHARMELQRNIDADEPDRELYGEKFARVAREQEAELRRVTGNPNAIHNPFRR